MCANMYSSMCLCAYGRRGHGSYGYGEEIGGREREGRLQFVKIINANNNIIDVRTPNSN